MNIDAANVKLEIGNFRLVKRDPVTKEPFEIIEGDETGITKIWKKGESDAANEHGA